MFQNCNDCKYKYTYEKCRECCDSNMKEKGDPRNHFLTFHGSQGCTYYESKEEGCINCNWKLKCILKKENKK